MGVAKLYQLKISRCQKRKMLLLKNLVMQSTCLRMQEKKLI